LFSNAVAARLGVNSTDLECLGYLVDGPVTAGRLAEATGLTSGAITGVIDRLERAGFARRERDTADRRRVLVHATALVMKRAAPLFAPMAAATEAAIEPYRDDQLELLLDFLARARDAGRAALAALGEGRSED
jgi:DNA-binding MarR family transcriptional regulator